MIYYTKYAEEKFNVLREHKFSLTKEDIDKIITAPEKIKRFDKKLLQADGRYSDEYNVRVIFKRENNTKKIITFYPVRK